MTDLVVPASDLGTEVAIDLAHSEADAREAVDVLAQVWGGDDGQKPLPAELAWVFAHSGNYVSLARVDGAVVGAAIGFRAVDDDGPHLHSHIAGVLPGHRGANVGYGLKQHQRHWALDAGLDRITWTFDPLVSRNAYFNIVKLGADITSHHVDFYGRMDDGINNGDESDRCVVTWHLAGAKAALAAAGGVPSVDLAAARATGGREVLRVAADGGPALEPLGPVTPADCLLVQLPGDIVEVRQGDPALGSAWRHALRAVLVPAFAAGLTITGVTKDSWYVVSRPSA